MAHERFIEVVSGEARGLGPAMARAGLALLEPGYAVAVAARHLAFDLGLRRRHDLGRPTVSVGNLTTGGTGKTPVVEALAAHLIERGRRPAILLRGHGASADAVAQEAGPPGPRHQASDEAMAYRRRFGAAALVAADPDRVRAAAWALHHRPDTDVLLLDDGFQHRRVRRDRDIVLIDATCPFGYDHLLPRGLLREPLRSLARADAVVITRADRVAAGALGELRAALARRVREGVPILEAEHAWVGLVDHAGAGHAVDALRDTPTFAFCGIGRPGPFFEMAEAHTRLVGRRVFDDHHAYSDGDRLDLRRVAERVGAAALLTTVKDAVKLVDAESGPGDLADREPSRGGPPMYTPTLRVKLRGGATWDDLLGGVPPG